MDRFFTDKYERNEWLFCVSVSLLWVFGIAVAVLS